ncbi:unnamed protein product [Ixodes pacificus]
MGTGCTLCNTVAHAACPVEVPRRCGCRGRLPCIYQGSQRRAVCLLQQEGVPLRRAPRLLRQQQGVHTRACGVPGPMNDARILTNSGLDDILSALPEDLHILGDSAYLLRVNLIRPYKDNGHLTRRQSHFNTTLGASRSVIERAFAQLKGKF